MDHHSETTESKLECKDINNPGIYCTILKKYDKEYVFRALLKPQPTSHITNLQNILIRYVNVNLILERIPVVIVSS